MLGLGGVEGSIRESVHDTEPWDKENPITAIVSGIVGEKIIFISHGAHNNDSFFKLYYYNYLTTGCRDFFLFLNHLIFLTGTRALFKGLRQIGSTSPFRESGFLPSDVRKMSVNQN